MLLRIGFAAQHHGGRAAGRRAGHRARHDAGPHHLLGHHVLGGDHRAEHRHRVVGGMAAGLGADLGKGLHRRAEALHVVQAGGAEQLQGGRDAVRHHARARTVEQFQRGGTVGVDRAQRARVHLLEAEGQHDVGHAAGNGLVCQVQRGRAAGAIVVDVDDRDAGHADVVQHALAAGGIAEDVAGVGRLDRFIANARIRQRQPHGLRAHRRVRIALARLLERDHAHACNHDFLRHVFLLEYLDV
ncbi:hypothetical protein D9M72_454550 [compost metagenome]